MAAGAMMLSVQNSMVNYSPKRTLGRAKLSQVMLRTAPRAAKRR
ncbi:hypothetical protein PhaeoP72_03850 (plasmid) [Phaeobacter inhibens]|nr:hypothetical protein PhaeoP72_03850 [Phaeobacter inhibens]